MKWLILSALLMAKLAGAEELIEGYLIYDAVNPLCPVSAEALPNILKADLESLPAEQRKVIAGLIDFYQFLNANLSGYCLIRLRRAEHDTQEVFIPQSVYDDLYSGPTATQLMEQKRSHFIRLKGEELVDGPNRATRGYDIRFALADRRPEISK